MDLEDDFQNNIHKILLELENLNSTYEKSEVSQTQISRNHHLVELLKILYQGKCQLCDPNAPIPLICKENGELYTEFHHITSLSEASNDDDIQYIDSYKNAIVLCPHHHKYVHFHHGGFKKIIEVDGTLYLQNERGEQLKVFTNHHLSTTIEG